MNRLGVMCRSNRAYGSLAAGHYRNYWHRAAWSSTQPTGSPLAQRLRGRMKSPPSLGSISLLLGKTGTIRRTSTKLQGGYHGLRIDNYDQMWTLYFQAQSISNNSSIYACLRFTVNCVNLGSSLLLHLLLLLLLRLF